MEKHIKQRMEGVLPVIKIGNDRFVFDIKANALFHKDSAGPIYIHNMSRAKKGLRFLYDPSSRTMASPPSTLLFTYPKDIVIIQMPFPATIDPVGFAKMHHINAANLLKIIPYKAIHEVKIIPWHKTRYSKNIQQSAEQKKNHKQQPAKIKRARSGKRSLKM